MTPIKDHPQMNADVRRSGSLCRIESTDDVDQGSSAMNAEFAGQVLFARLNPQMTPIRDRPQMNADVRRSGSHYQN
jgi:hypothetical protein